MRLAILIVSTIFAAASTAQADGLWRNFTECLTRALTRSTETSLRTKADRSLENGVTTAMNPAPPVAAPPVKYIEPVFPEPKYDPALRAWARELKDAGNSILPRIPPEKLEEVRPVYVPAGTASSTLFSATLDGKKVFMKAYTSHRIEEEAKMLMIANRIGLAPKFHGLSTVRGETVLVIDYVEGYILRSNKIPNLPPPSFTITREMFETMKADITHAGQALYEAGVTDTRDLQFILTPEGRAVLVDLDSFKLGVREQWPQESGSEDPRKRAHYLIRRLSEVVDSPSDR